MSTDHSTAGGSAITEDGLRIWSCVTCRRRKVKCDRRDPCSNCIKNQIECHFPATGRLPRRRDSATWKSPTEKQAELLDRLRRLEALVTELAAQVEDGPEKIQSILPGSLSSVAGVLRSSETVNAEIGKRGPSDWELPVAFEELVFAMESRFEEETNEDFGRLVVGKEAGVQVGKGFWSVFCSEVEHIFHGIQDMASTTSGSNLEDISSNSRASLDNMYSDFYLGNACAEWEVPQGLDDLYPLPSQILFIWRTYVDNVDPFIKVIDVAALEEVMANLRGKFDLLRPSLQALLFAVSLAAITSLDEEDILNCFDMPRRQLLARFRLGTERALANAGLIVTKEVETVQAFVIYLSLLPHIGGQELLSPLIGLLLRIATSLQLHRDAEIFKTPALTPAEIEVRRRLWWQIVFIDSTSRTGRIAGLSASDTIFDVKAPSCILNDGRKTFEMPFDAQIEPIICVMRCEIWLLCRLLNANQRKPLEQKLQTFNWTRSRIEDSCIARVLSNHALVSLIKAMASLAFSKVEHTIYLQHFRQLKELSQTPSQEMTQHHLELSINILIEAHRLRTESAWKRWRWQLQGDFPWASMSAVFIQLCQSPWSTVSERGLALTRQILEKVPEKVKGSPLWDRLNKLITAAEAHRGDNLREVAAQTCPHNGTCTCSFVDTNERGKGGSVPIDTQRGDSHILVDYSDFDRELAFGVFNSVELDESNELESIMIFNPMEWQAWDEALVMDN
ncbi:hypothetical protein ACHAQJ_010500 [Trichoderma viride]